MQDDAVVSSPASTRSASDSPGQPARRPSHGDGLLGVLVKALVRLLFGRSYRGWRRGARWPQRAADRTIRKICRAGAQSEFGKAHDFSTIRNIDDYRRLVPVRSPDDYALYLNAAARGGRVLSNDAPIYFAETSGTSSHPKLIPVTPGSLKRMYAVRRLWFRQLLLTMPRILGGKILALHSPQADKLSESGVPIGPLSAAALRGPRHLRDANFSRSSRFDIAPMAVYALEDSTLKYDLVIRLALQSRIRLAAAINPSTLLVLFKHLETHAARYVQELETGEWAHLAHLPGELRGKIARMLRRSPKTAARLRAAQASGEFRVDEIWPGFCGFACWTAGTTDFYRERLAAYAPDHPMLDYGYMASEGYYAIPTGSGAAGHVWVPSGGLLEFLDLETQKILLAHELVEGRAYRLIVSNENGLYRYDIQDVVQCVGGFKKLKGFRFVRRAGAVSSVTGEKLTESQVITAFSQLMGRGHLEGAESYYLQVEFGGDVPRYALHVEIKRPAQSDALQAASIAFDELLAEINGEYASKRGSNRLGPVRCVATPVGTLATRRSAKLSAGSADGQIKLPHLLPPPIDSSPTSKRGAQGEGTQ